MLDGHFVSSPAAASQLAVQAFLRTMALVLPCSWTCRLPQKGFKARSIFLRELASLLWIQTPEPCYLSYKVLLGLVVSFKDLALLPWLVVGLVVLFFSSPQFSRTPPAQLSWYPLNFPCQSLCWFQPPKTCPGQN